VLSLKRAESVRDWMRDTGDVPESCFAVQGYGASRPVATNDTPEGVRSTAVSKSVWYRRRMPVRYRANTRRHRRMMAHHNTMESNSMAIPVYLWLKDDGGADIKGSVDVQDREGSIEVVAQEHNLYIPTDNNTGKLTGTRIHTPFLFTKEIDSSSPYVQGGDHRSDPQVCGIQVVQDQRRGPGSGVLQHQTRKREGGESEP
jgi:hypothetical protein